MFFITGNDMIRVRKLNTRTACRARFITVNISAYSGFKLFKVYVSVYHIGLWDFPGKDDHWLL